MSDISAAQLLAQLRSMASAAGAPQPEAAARPEAANFSDLFAKAIDHVNGSQQEVQSLREGFQQGDPRIDVSDVMIASQKANIEFQLLMQVRNRLISAYQDVMNMQI
jgi:flagellar hook-basal body complex protein FliE